MAYYCTLAQMQTETEELDADFNTAQLQVIENISDRITYEDQLKSPYGFEPELKAVSLSADTTAIVNRGRELLLPQPLLALTTLTIDEAVTTVTSDQYILRGDGGSLYSAITLKQNAGLSFRSWSGDPADAISITGVWGYHTNYAQAWRSTTTINEDLDTTETAIIVVLSSALSPGHLIKVDDEYMRVLVVTDATNITVERAVNGTTAAAHTTAATLYRWQWDRRINDACIRWAGYRWQRKGGFNRVTYDPTGTVTEAPDDMPGDVKGALSTFPDYRLWTTA